MLGGLAWAFSLGAAESPSALPKRALVFSIQRFEVAGSDAIEPAEVDRLMRPATGNQVTLPQIRQAMERLQEAYRERGVALAGITLPRQDLGEGTVRLKVRLATEEPPPQPAEVTQTPANPPPAKAPPEDPKFEVRGFDVSGNTLLSLQVINNALTNAVGPAITFPVVRKALGELQLAYRQRGFATVAVSLPQQRLTNGIVRVEVTEGLLTDIQVAGNQHFSSNNVRRSLPSLRTNVVLNSTVFQRELDIANQNRDRQVYPTIGPGPEPGTSALTLRVKDRLPLHGRLDVNNQSTPRTPEWRINTSAQYNNLWQLEHSVGLSYGFSPEVMKDDEGPPSNWPLRPGYWLSRPLIANYGAYYRLPFGTPESVEERIRSSASFGFDEVSRQFRLPPAGSRPELSVYASEASSDTGVQYTPSKLVSQTPLLTIVSRDSGRDVSLNQSAGSRISLPLTLSDTRRFTFSGGPDWKRFKLDSFNTNNFLITTVITNAQGSQTISSEVPSPQPPRHQDLSYLPLSANVDYSQTDARGTLTAGMGLSGNFVGSSKDFAGAAYSTNTSPNFGRLTLSLSRDQKLPFDGSLLARASAQIATGALISNEQFGVGGLNSVRGYYEGDQFGDSGWFASIELRTPFLRSSVPLPGKSVPAWIRGSIFVDYGQRLLLEHSPGAPGTLSLWGAGVGLSANVNNHIDLRVAVGWPLLDSPNIEAGDPRAYFSVGGQF